MSTANGAVCVADLDLLRQVGADCLQAALQYLALGWSVLPLCNPAHVGVGKKHQHECKQPGKVPIIRWKDYQERLPTEDEVRGWWRQNPTYNVGTALGPVSNIIRVDVDGPGGEALLRELSGGDLPPTLEFDSGRKNGGRGLLYRIPADAPPLKTTPHSQGKSEELRFQARGAQTALPPSLHVSGSRYTWKPGHGPEDRQAADAPAWLIEQLRLDGPGAQRRKAAPLADGEMIVDGKRDDTLTSLAGSMRRRGMSEESMAAALLVENEQRCDPPLPEEQVRKIARSVARYEPQPEPTVILRRRAPDASKTFTVGPLELRSGVPRRTKGGKLTVPLAVHRAGRPVDLITFASSTSGRKETAAAIAAHWPDGDRAVINEVLGQVATWAAEAVERPADRGGPTVASVVAARVPDALGIACRTERGLWSEKRGGEVTRGDFIAYNPSWLLDAVRGAADAPPAPDGAADLASLLRAVRAALEVTWADLLESLPVAEGSQLGRDTAAGRQFREAMVKLWTRPMTFEVARAANTAETVASRASLISRVRSQALPARPPESRERWREVQRAFAAWWRPWVDDQGELLTLLALRWELPGQVGVELPAVHDQASLTALGTRYGVLCESPPVTAMLSGGQHRLGVLSLDLTEELLAQPAEDDCSVTE